MVKATQAERKMWRMPHHAYPPLSYPLYNLPPGVKKSSGKRANSSGLQE